MLLPSVCVLVVVYLMLLGGSSTDGTSRESKILKKWKSSSDTEGTIDKERERRDENIANTHIRIERAGDSKQNKLIRRKSKKQLKRKYMKKDNVNQIHPLLEVKAPLDYHTLIDLLNAGVRQSQQQALNTKIQSMPLVNDQREPFRNNKSQKGKNHIDVNVSTENKQAGNRNSTSKTNLQLLQLGPFDTPSKPTPTKDVTPFTRTQTLIHEHDNRYSTSRTNLQSSAPGPSENPLERMSTGDATPTARAQKTTQEQKDKASHTDTVITPLYSNVSSVGGRIRNNVLVPTVYTSLQRSKPSIHQADSQLGAAVSQNCNNTLDIITCMSSFSLRGLFSLMNPTTENPRKGQEAQVDTLKTRQVIMLANMFNKSLSQTWKLLIPHPKLVTVLESQTKSEGVFETQKDEETLRISSASPQWLLTKLKKKKGKVYTESDHRPSAIGIGSFGALVLVTIVVGIIILDSRSLYRDIRRLKRSIYNLCKPVYKHKLTISTSNNKGEKWAYVIHERQV
ncbi:uncharacterized protein LOC110445422 [Mizuhopecten yessoensis]|uniref:uncharacterized protein LOC110445422 n=1 Tax=Mizuhopecten yessoensis TaxID=6573 RepID=UPI000B459383|nr:uncharacterized protein LOC110445422 [Mizuhopecten yessoensis]